MKQKYFVKTFYLCTIYRTKFKNKKLVQHFTQCSHCFYGCFLCYGKYNFTFYPTMKSTINLSHRQKVRHQSTLWTKIARESTTILKCFISSFDMLIPEYHNKSRTKHTKMRDMVLGRGQLFMS